MPAYVGLSSGSLPLTTRTRAGTTFDLEEFYDVETLWQIYCRQVYDVRPQDRVIVDDEDVCRTFRGVDSHPHIPQCRNCV